MEIKRILIAGEGGQGIQALAHILTSAGFTTGMQVSFLPNFGVEQRGGVSLAFIEISDEPISFPKFQKTDVVVLFAARAIHRVEQYLDKDAIIIFDNTTIDPGQLDKYKLTKLAIPATKIARQKLIPKVFNIIMLGGLVSEIDLIPPKKVEDQIEKFFSEKIKKEPQLKHFNLQAFRLGYQIGQDLKKENKWREKIIKK